MQPPHDGPMECRGTGKTSASENQALPLNGFWRNSGAATERCGQPPNYSTVAPMTSGIQVLPQQAPELSHLPHPTSTVGGGRTMRQPGNTTPGHSGNNPYDHSKALPYPATNTLGVKVAQVRKNPKTCTIAPPTGKQKKNL